MLLLFYYKKLKKVIIHFLITIIELIQTFDVFIYTCLKDIPWFFKSSTKPEEFDHTQQKKGKSLLKRLAFLIK